MTMTLIRLRSTGEELVVGNTHIYWDPRRADVKAMQTHAVTKAVEHFLNDVREERTALTNGSGESVGLQAVRMRRGGSSMPLEHLKNHPHSLAQEGCSDGLASGLAGRAQQKLQLQQQSQDQDRPVHAIQDPPLVLCGDFNTMPDLDWDYSMDSLVHDGSNHPNPNPNPNPHPNPNPNLALEPEFRWPHHYSLIVAYYIYIII